MSLHTAQEFAWSLATTLMACTTLFRAGDEFSVMPTDEFDGDPATVVQEYDPHAR